MAKRLNKVSDVNSLSGAETRQFLALSALCLRILMPKEQRLNIQIFDEIEAGMSPANRNRFIEDFIPIVKEHVPNVVLISPQGQDVLNVPDSRTLTLTRHNNVTTAAFH
jgi:uncharacterized protein YnzC (UPF0291/DUF896 family)